MKKTITAAEYQKLIEKSTKEKSVSDDVRAFLEVRGWKVFRLNSGKARGFRNPGIIQLAEAGTADLLAIREYGTPLAFLVFIETKRPKGGKLRKSQVDWQLDMIKRGFMVWNIKNMNEMAERYREMGL